MMAWPTPVRTEVVEVPSFFVPRVKRLGQEGQGFDRLSPNGIWIDG